MEDKYHPAKDHLLRDSGCPPTCSPSLFQLLPESTVCSFCLPLPDCPYTLHQSGASSSLKGKHRSPGLQTRLPRHGQERSSRPERTLAPRRSAGTPGSQQHRSTVATAHDPESTRRALASSRSRCNSVHYDSPAGDSPADTHSSNEPDRRGCSLLPPCGDCRALWYFGKDIPGLRQLRWRPGIQVQYHWVPEACSTSAKLSPPKHEVC